MAKANKDTATPQPELLVTTGAEQSQNGDAGTENGAGEIEQDGDVSLAPAVGSAQPSASSLIRALVLRECGYGAVGSVVSLAAAEVATGAEQGALDPNDAAVAAAEG